MKLYLACVEKSYLPQLSKDSLILVSFAETRQIQILPLVKDRDVVIDSGAFTVWNQKRKGKKNIKEIDIEEYCAFLHANPHLTGAVSLDVIQGTAEEQLNNLNFMKAAMVPVPVWPVFHEGDDFELLREYIRSGYRKIAIAGTVNRGKPELMNWMWKVLEFAQPSESLQYHGLAMTQIQISKDFAGYLDSVDSSTWLAFARHGFDNNRPILDEVIKDTRDLEQIIRESSADVLREVGRMLMEYRFEGSKFRTPKKKKWELDFMKELGL